MVRAFERFNADLNQFLKDSDNSALYEDAFTSRQVRNFRLTEKGLLSWEEDDTTAPAFIRNGEPAEKPEEEPEEVIEEVIEEEDQDDFMLDEGEGDFFAQEDASEESFVEDAESDDTTDQ